MKQETLLRSRGAKVGIVEEGTEDDGDGRGVAVEGARALRVQLRPKRPGRPSMESLEALSTWFRSKSSGLLTGNEPGLLPSDDKIIAVPFVRETMAGPAEIEATSREG